MVSTVFLKVLITSISSILVAVSTAAEALESASFVMGELMSLSLKTAGFISSLPYCRVPFPNGLVVFVYSMVDAGCMVKEDFRQPFTPWRIAEPSDQIL